MSRLYLNDRWCGRCMKATPTPYLVKSMRFMPTRGTVLDIGCGNGRNSFYMSRRGYRVVAVDMAVSFANSRINTSNRVLGKDDLPRGVYDIILANYVLMFLLPRERLHVFRDIQLASKLGTVMVIEMYPAKDAKPYDLNKIIKWFTSRGWKLVQKTGEHCVLGRVKNAI